MCYKRVNVRSLSRRRILLSCRRIRTEYRRSEISICLGCKIAGIATPTFFGTNLINFTGAIKNTNSRELRLEIFTPPQRCCFRRNPISRTAATRATSRSNDSYFASPVDDASCSCERRQAKHRPSMFIDGGSYGALPSKVPSDGTYPFAYVDVTSESGVKHRRIIRNRYRSRADRKRQWVDTDSRWPTDLDQCRAITTAMAL